MAPRSREFHRRRAPGDLLYPLLLLLEVAAFHRHVLFYPGHLFPWDFRAVHLPLAQFVADSLRAGELPLWDPFTYCGYPIYANIQTALFYPPVLLATAASCVLGADLLPRLLAIAVVLQIAFAGVCAYVLMRRVGGAPSAAWIGATVYQLGCFFASQAQHMGAVQGATWLPLACVCLVELRSSLRLRWLALLAAALSMTILAGLPQVAFAVFAAVIGLSLLMTLFRLGDRYLPLRAALACAWAVALAAIQFIPTAELTRHSVAKYRAEWLHAGGGIRLEALSSLLVPNYWNVFDLAKFHGPGDPTFLYLYASLGALALVLIGMVWKPDAWTRALSVATLGAALCMLGESTPLGSLIFQALPVDIRIGIHPEFFLCVFSFAFALLAGLSANRWLAGARLASLVGALIAIDLIAAGSGRPFNISSYAREPGITRHAAEGSRELIANLHALTGSASPPYRFDMKDDVAYLWSSTAPLYRIPTANGCDPLAPERVIQVRLAFAPGERWGTCYQVVNPSSPALDLINVRYLLARSEVSSPGFGPAGETAGYRIYENTRAMPRAFLAYRIERARNLAEAARRLHSPDFDPAETAIVEGLPDEPPPQFVAGGKVEVAAYRPSSIELRTDSQGPAFLVVTDTHYPGWEATVDGKRVPMYVTDVAFRGVLLPAGTHHVEMRFVPWILYWSAAISLAAWLALAAAGLRFPR